MILKQRFETGRTQFIDLGNNFVLVQRSADDFETTKKGYFGEQIDTLGKDVHTFVRYGERKEEPLYVGFPQWIYSNDGTLFLTLTEHLSDDWYKETENDRPLDKQTLAEARDINDKINAGTGTSVHK